MHRGGTGVGESVVHRLDDVDANASIDVHLARLFETDNAGDDGNDDPAGNAAPTPLPVALTEQMCSAKSVDSHNGWTRQRGQVTSMSGDPFPIL